MKRWKYGVISLLLAGLLGPVSYTHLVHQDLSLYGGQLSVRQRSIGPLLHLNADAAIVSQDLFPIKFCHNVASFHLFEVKLFRCVMFIP